VIFEDMDPVWLMTMWKDGGTARADMIEILISLALLSLDLSFDLLILLENNVYYVVMVCTST
jgi:hypothetical protein